MTEENEQDEELEEMKQEKAEELAAGDHEIEIFTTPSCPYCSKLKQWMEEEGIEYTEWDVASNREKAIEMIQQTGQQGVPQTIIDGEQAVIGFQPDRIKDIIES